MEKFVCHSESQLSFDFDSVTEPESSTVLSGATRPSDRQLVGRERFTVIVGGGGLNLKDGMPLEPTSDEVTRILRSTVKAIGW